MILADCIPLLCSHLASKGSRSCPYEALHALQHVGKHLGTHGEDVMQTHTEQGEGEEEGRKKLQIHCSLLLPGSRAMYSEPPADATLLKSHSLVEVFHTDSHQPVMLFLSPAFPGDSCRSWLALLASHISHPAACRSIGGVQQGGNLLPPGTHAAHLGSSWSSAWVLWLDTVSKGTHRAGRDCTIEQHLPSLHSVVLMENHVGWSC